jgi:hypothetical protein
MGKWLILLSALSSVTASGAPAWTWVDETGQVHYSDRPVPGATQVELSGAQGFSAPPRAVQPPAAQTGPAPAADRYRVLEIASPAEQQTLWNIGGNLTVTVSLDPPLTPGHRVDLAYDGQRLNLNLATTGFALTQVFRGVHSLQAIVIDANGAEVQRSASRTFVIQQTSIQNPNAPLARRPRAGN